MKTENLHTLERAESMTLWGVFTLGYSECGRGVADLDKLGTWSVRVGDTLYIQAHGQDPEM